LTDWEKIRMVSAKMGTVVPFFPSAVKDLPTNTRFHMEDPADESIPTWHGLEASEDSGNSGMCDPLHWGT
jgi:hypothetical protein